MTLERPMFPPRADSNVLTFPAGGRRVALRNPSFNDSRPPTWEPWRRRANMHTLVFRSRKLIIEVDDATLLADVRVDLEKAERKLAAVRKQLRTFTEHAQKEISTLTAVDAKLGAAVAAARSSMSAER